MIKFPIVHVESCALCPSHEPLRESHIIPHFVFDWLLESSATGYMRLGIAPNVRVQDGAKQHLLCDDCEKRLSRWETEVAQALFRPYHEDSSVEVRYGAWLAKFCTSVAWRVLFIYRGLGLTHCDSTQAAQVDRALEVWADFMFDRLPHPGAFELHLLPVDVLGDAESRDLPVNINRYLTRAVEMDVARNDDSAFVYVKMCKLIVVGFIQMPKPREWRGTRVAVREGVVRPSQYLLPAEFGGYLLDQARRMAELQACISGRQRNRIADTMRSNLDRVASSDTLEAMHHDVMMFGNAAFAKPED